MPLERRPLEEAGGPSRYVVAAPWSVGPSSSPPGQVVRVAPARQPCHGVRAAQLAIPDASTPHGGRADASPRRVRPRAYRVSAAPSTSRRNWCPVRATAGARAPRAPRASLQRARTQGPGSYGSQQQQRRSGGRSSTADCSESSLPAEDHPGSDSDRPRARASSPTDCCTDHPMTHDLQDHHTQLDELPPGDPGHQPCSRSGRRSPGRTRLTTHHRAGDPSVGVQVPRPGVHKRTERKADVSAGRRGTARPSSASGKAPIRPRRMRPSTPLTHQSRAAARRSPPLRLTKSRGRSATTLAGRKNHAT